MTNHSADTFDPATYSRIVRRDIEDGSIRFSELSRGATDWPASLRDGCRFDTLYVAGDKSVLDGPLVALTGSRRPTAKQLAAAKACGEAAASAGVPLVSGSALGCDLEAAAACLAKGGSVVVVPGTGVDVLYPQAASGVFSAALSGRGCVCSPYPLGTEPGRWQFPHRNELIAGMADLLICPAARRPSGSLTTIELALKADVPVLLVEGSGITARDLFPYSGLVDTVFGGDSLKETLADEISAARGNRVVREVARRLSDALPQWGVNVVTDRFGLMVECEAFAGPGCYDYVATIDMRGHDARHASEWHAAMMELVEGFDLDDVMRLALGSPDAPDAETMVVDLADVRDRLLPELSDAVVSVSTAVASKLGPASGNACLASLSHEVPRSEPEPHLTSRDDVVR